MAILFNPKLDVITNKIVYDTNARFLIVKCKIRENNLCLINVYAPVSTEAPNQRLFVEMLDQMLNKHCTNGSILLAGDFNINPMLSPALDAAVSDGQIVDIFSEWAPDETALAATFCRTGVYEHMQGPGKTRIDAIFSNKVAAHLVDQVEIRWNRSLGFDHACLAVSCDESESSQA